MSFRLVQRLEAAPNGRPRNIFGADTSLFVSKLLLDAGAKVDLEYMGSAEFEAREILIGAANRIGSAANSLLIVTKKLTRPTYEEDVSFVGVRETVEGRIREWETWTDNPKSKEPIGYFKDIDADRFPTTVGWWALDEDVIWTREEQVAEDIRGAFVAVLGGTE